MNLSDIIALAKQGYKPADIRELIALGNEQEKKQPEPQPDPDPITPPEPAAEPVPEQVTEPVERRPEAAEETADTNKDTRVEELERQIAELQAANARRGQPNQTKSNAEILDEMVKNFV